jgi:hypothetical protein
VRRSIESLFTLIRIEDETTPESLHWTETELKEILNRVWRFIKRYKLASNRDQLIRLCQLLEREYSKAKKTKDFRDVNSLVNVIVSFIPKYFT